MGGGESKEQKKVKQAYSHPVPRVLEVITYSFKHRELWSAPMQSSRLKALLRERSVFIQFYNYLLSVDCVQVLLRKSS